ncbi:unnamed protein product [Dimorphilus gyrociliatus]|uniref:Uncharacterized protein n=1 Tax=Dimorphilus gyrociliatus TaxID=2664684 RepID=A0A7I8V7R3_9ANNE|nr:unnamed protein product [Dimorphilus gyrociliatus]
MYQRIGGLMFGLGTIVYAIVKIFTLVSNCPKHGQGEFVTQNALYLLFLIVQTLFLVKHPQLQLLNRRYLIKFGLMHVALTNICVWIRTLCEETQHSFQSYNNNGSSELTIRRLLISNSANSSTDCIRKEALLNKSTPYLFPCVLEYSLLASATMLELLSEVEMSLKEKIDGTIETLGKKDSAINCQNEQNLTVRSSNMSSHLISHIDFRKIHGGLISGLLVLAALIAVTIIFLTLDNTSKSSESQKVYLVTDFVLNLINLAGLIFTMFKMSKLTYRKKAGSKVDCTLLYIALGGQLFFHIARIIGASSAAVDKNDRAMIFMTIVDSVFAILASVVQAIFIQHASSLHTTNSDDARSMPGRSPLTFLLICNIACWLFRTLQMKSSEIDGEHFGMNVYRPTAWILIVNVSIPLLIFYSYHCSAMIADIWSRSYNLKCSDESHLEGQLTGNLTRPSSCVVKPARSISEVNILKQSEDEEGPSITVMDTARRLHKTLSKSTRDKGPNEIDIDRIIKAVSASIIEVLNKTTHISRPAEDGKKIGKDGRSILFDSRVDAEDICRRASLAVQKALRSLD